MVHGVLSASYDAARIDDDDDDDDMQ